MNIVAGRGSGRDGKSRL